MHRLRSIWGLRVLVIVLMAGIMPAVLGPGVRAAQPSSADAYADWLRDYLISPTDPVVARALDAASSTKAQTFDDFLRVFIKAFEAQQSDMALADVFSVEAQNTDALVWLLYGQYQQVLGGVSPARATLSATSSGLAGITDRTYAILPDTDHDGAGTHRLDFPLHFLSDLAVVTPIRVYWTAFPQGP